MSLARWIAAAAAAGLALSASAPAAAQDEDLDDILGGFEDEEEDSRFEADASDPVDTRWWDLSGSLDLTGSINYIPHRSDTGTDYTGLQRLRNRLRLQLDVELPRDWELRLEGWGFWDAAYLANGRSNYTSDVLDDYELDAELAEAWVHGQVIEDVDLKIGRQVVIWGRSETLRVLDILNPLDNREPGRVDLEGIRRPVAMARAEAFIGDWTFQALWIPEIRFDRNPVRGSDFYPGIFEPPQKRPENVVDSEFAGAVTGIFSGWDVSFHGAWFWHDRARFRHDPVPMKLIHDRLWMVGSGGNYTVGPWLFKYEVAFFGDIGFYNSDKKNRFDGLLGVEYYGFTDTSISFEILNRHILDYDGAILRLPDFTRENTQEIALRLRRDFLNQRLHFNALGVIFGWDARDGSIARFDVEYDLMDALVVSFGILLYQSGDLPPLSGWGPNDRLIFKAKWSF